MAARTSDATDSEPIALTRRAIDPPSRRPGLRSHALWFSSRGDRVPARLVVPSEGDGPFPAAVLQPPAGASKDDDRIDAAAATFAQGGMAVVTVDLPLHGERAEGKLTVLLLDELAAGGGPLSGEFYTQAALDLARAVTVMGELPEIDATRIGFAGLGLGARLGASLCAADPRVRAAALAPLDASGPELSAQVAGIAPRPLLVLDDARRDVESILEEMVGFLRNQLAADGGR